MREIRVVVVTTAKPSGPDDLGQVAEGRYFVENGILTMCNSDSIPLRDENNGQRITSRLLPGESEKAAAKRLTLKIHRAANREMSGFHKPIRYPKWGGA
ncbi:MAG TPA: hypothetical protein VKY22_29435 [Bradyrhizobium sp.]|nr:hypothetical protein [Bradyrhizobium sp.]